MTTGRYYVQGHNSAPHLQKEAGVDPIADIGLVVQVNMIFRVFVDMHLSVFEFPGWQLSGEENIQFFICSILRSKVLASESDLWGASGDRHIP